METTHHLLWSVNGLGIDHLGGDPDIKKVDLESPGHGVLRQGLTVHATLEKNNTIITCGAVTAANGIITILNVTIQIQGNVERNVVLLNEM